MGNGNKAEYPLPTVMCSNRELHQPGMTLREYYAGLAMQGLVMGFSTEILLKRTNYTGAEDAVRIADALLKALEGPQ